MNKNILLVKETRAGEKRVALVPEDVGQLALKGYTVYVESGAGAGAGFVDADYVAQGANIRQLASEALAGYQALFKEIGMVVRAKRPSREREILENQSIPEGATLMGALDPFELGSPHMAEYAQRKLQVHSIDQLSLPTDDPMNLLSAMSKIAGKLAVQDALQKIRYAAQIAVIIGFGVIGQAALEEVLGLGLSCIVCLTNTQHQKPLEMRGVKTLLLDKFASLQEQQSRLIEVLKSADVVIASARRTNQRAPLLIPHSTLQKMKSGSVIVDMALSEGGNVEGSHHDKTMILGNGVVVTNVSGYPKYVPHEASILWSKATRFFIEKHLAPDSSKLRPVR